jgi:hypothetical protein
LARKKTRAKPVRIFAHVNVLQNGVSIASDTYPIGKSRIVELTNQKSRGLLIPHYPLPNNAIPFLFIYKNEIRLLVPFKWEGFCTTNGSPVTISTTDGTSSREVALVKGDYASLFYDDLRIMLKLSPIIPSESLDRKVGSAFRQSISKFLLSSKEEAPGLAFGCLAAVVIIGCFLFGLLARPSERPTSIRDIPEEYLLAFISPDLLRNAPEALKLRLNRRQFATSVLDHYQDVTSILSNDSTPINSKYFPFTKRQYEEIHHRTTSKIKNAIERQKKVDSDQQNKAHVAQVLIPAVIGETLGGSMVRIVDKISIIQDGLVETLEKRRAITSSFPKDQEYGFEEYKNIPKNDKNSEFLAKIKPWEKLSDEQMMYEEAERLAFKAKRKQKNILAFNDPNDQLNPMNTKSIGMEEGSRLSTFIHPTSFSSLDAKISLLNGSEYGFNAKKEVVKEPLIGVIEPHLVEKFIQENRYQLQLCYELALRRNEETSGVMEWKWRIDSRGSISDISLIKTNIDDRHLAKCLQDKISRWRFPRPRRGAVEVSYPFEFAPHKGKG